MCILTQVLDDCDISRVVQMFFDDVQCMDGVYVCGEGHSLCVQLLHTLRTAYPPTGALNNAKP